ncbi:tetratricopeptide repeat protein [Moorena sp. SIO3H5]|uniref:tetratricopeptide repeat protein n=1 Tax=Moorena sp. SIO3H5 TaxID=2607834 RepID=UPI0013BE26F6|nr:tetratricopeptide repeat protein [Moorena sp. SIO3H5]NEO72667.1 tetratricopeptide repeat protein [Moorena sp. SIO3H5]
MDEERLQAYLNLIQQLLTCPSGEQVQILESNRELVDAELLQVMTQEAEKLAADGNQNSADVLLRLRSELLEIILESSTLVNPSSQNYLEFFINVLLVTAISNGDPKVVYPLLESNLDKLDDNFIDILQTWASAKLSELEPETAEIMARVIGNFSNFISDFTLGNKANNMDIAIAGYEIMLRVIIRDSNPESWAAIQNNLGNAYLDRIHGYKADNLELAIEALQLALSVYTKPDFREYWANTQIILGYAYSQRIRGDKTDNLERALEAYQLALSVYTKPDFPEIWAIAQNNLGNAYSKRILGNCTENLEKAIASYQNASEIFTREAFPQDWADVQRNIGKLLVQRGSWYDGLSRLEQSLAIYRQTENLECRADAIYHIARTHHLMMNLDKARMHYRDALRIYDYIKNQEGIAACKTGLGRLMISLGFIDDAREELNQACEIYHTLKDNKKIDNIQEIFQLLAKSKINKLKQLNPSNSHE